MRLPAIVKNATLEVTDRFQDGRRRHVGNSRKCYKSDENGTQTKKNMLSLKITISMEIQVRAIKRAITTRI
jgi:hypothetical protein